MTPDAQVETAPERPGQPAAEEGFLLLGLLVVIAILLLWLGVAATNEAFAIRREREVETARRADQYIRAIRLYYKKFGHYPGSVDQLEKSNNIRFLRRKWIDPLTHTSDWRTIAVGQNQTTVKSFFGEPLAGLPTTGLGALAGSQSPGMPGSTIPGAATAPGAPAAGAGFGASTPGGITGAPTGAAAAATGATGTGTAASATSGTGAPGSNTTTSPLSSGNGLGGNSGAFMGVGTNATGNSILEINGQTTYETWEFLYDPRLEQLRLKQQLNSGMQSNGAGAFGQTPTSNGQDSTAPGATTPGNPSLGNPNPGSISPGTNPGTTTPPPGQGTAPAAGGDTPLRP